MTGPKRARQQAILEAIAERPIGSQEELRQILLRQGLDVTQSTLSRDLRDLRIARVPTASGVRYVVSEPASEDAQRAGLAAILPQLFSSIEGGRGPGGAQDRHEWCAAGGARPRPGGRS